MENIYFLNIPLFYVINLRIAYVNMNIFTY